MSPSREQATPLLNPSGSAGKIGGDGRRTYRMVAPQVIWWGWAVLLVLALADLLIQGHDLVSLKFALGALTATGLVFACTLWPKVVADDDGITVLNPFRRFDIPWGAVKGIYVGDSVEVQCARGGQKKDKTVYSWALSAPRRARTRAQMRGRQWDRGSRSAPVGFGRLSGPARGQFGYGGLSGPARGQAAEIASMLPAEAIARELAGLTEEFRTRHGGTADSGEAASGAMGTTPGDQVDSGVAEAGADEGAAAVSGEAPRAVMAARWEWLPLAAVLLPGIAFAISEIVK